MSGAVLQAGRLHARVPSGREILHGLDLSLAPGEKVALVGPNGAGKSSLLRVLAGIWPVSSGEVRVGGKNLNAYRRKALARQLAYLPQQTHLGFELTVKEVVAQGLYSREGLSPAQARAEITQAMAATGVSDLARRLLPSLSGGERQRVLLARAMAQGAPLLLLDEPATALDIRHTLDLLDLLDELSASGVTLLVAMHDLELAARRFDRVVVLSQGRLLCDGQPRTVFEDPQVAACFEVEMFLQKGEGDQVVRLVCQKPVGR